MSLSKNIHHCRQCVNLVRHYQSGNSGAVDSFKMSIKNLSLTQWKIINQLRDYVMKISSDKNIRIELNQELAQFLQKLQPSVYGTGFIRNVQSPPVESNRTEETKTVQPHSEETKVQKSEVKETDGYSLPNVLSGFKLKLGKDSDVPQPIVPKWKQLSKISKASILSRTRHIISSIATAENELSRINRIEDLSSHIQQYPEAKTYAVKEDAIGVLLRIKHKCKNENVEEALNEAFAVLGYSKPLPNQGIRILSIDGGGIRGLLVIEMLKKLEELTGKKVHEMFDFICGVSTGAILSCALGANQAELDEVSKCYKELATQIFSQNTFWGTSGLVWSHSYYDTTMWETFLKEYVGETELIKTSRNSKCPKLAAISAVVNKSRVSAYVFRNYSLPYRVQSQYMGSSGHRLWEAVRASAAAPTYFEECKLGNLLHQDGGILVNNPTAVAIHEARQLWPDSPLQCVISFGTGRTDVSHIDSEGETTGNSLSWKNKFLKILDSATDTEAVHTMLSDLLPPNVYFRFNPYLTEMISMVEIQPEKISQLERDALMYLRRNEDKFQEAAKALLLTKTPVQKAVDWVNLQREIIGFSIK